MLRHLLLCVLAAGLLGCAGTAGDPAAWRTRPHDPGPLDLPARAVDPGCPRTPAPGDAAPWTLALPGAVDPVDAPLPVTEAERHVFRALYETLLRVDCAGQLQPALAESWQAYDDGRFWVLRLRAGAVFWDGTPVTPAAIMAAWRRAELLCRLRGEASPFLLFEPGEALSELGPRELGIRLATPSDTLPLSLTHPALAITGGAGPHGWPLGSGPCRPASAPGQGRLALLPWSEHPAAPPWSRLDLLLDDPRDPRELLDVGADALVTRRRSVSDYYAGRRGTAQRALPWDRWYYLVTPTEETGADPRDRRRWTSGWDRRELAREVSAQDAEPADFFAFEPHGGACAVLPPPVPQLPPAPALDAQRVRTARDADLVVWPDDDPDAGRLAERLAVLAARPLRPGPDRPSRGPLTPPTPPGPGDAPEAAAVPARDLTAHVQSARAGAVLLPWQRRLPTPCDELARLLSLARWLQDAGLRSGASTEIVPPGARAADPMDTAAPTQTLAVARRLENSNTVQPLIRSRAHLIHHPDLVGLRWDHDGALLLWTGGWRRGALTWR
jgi:hypothetical protein